MYRQKNKCLRRHVYKKMSARLFTIQIHPHTHTHAHSLFHVLSRLSWRRTCGRRGIAVRAHTLPRVHVEIHRYTRWFVVPVVSRRDRRKNNAGLFAPTAHHAALYTIRRARVFDVEVSISSGAIKKSQHACRDTIHCGRTSAHGR